MIIKKNYIITLDIETIIDKKLMKDIKKNTKEQYNIKKKYNFANIFLHKIVSISFLLCKVYYSNSDKEYYKIINFQSHKYFNNEKKMIISFMNLVKNINTRIISYNGKNFDIQVLKYRSIKNNITFNWLYQKGNKWNNYNSRYQYEWHCDLLECILKNTTGKMSDICQVLNIKCKSKYKGDSIQKLYEKKYQYEIDKYCKEDVLCTYILYLKFFNSIGKISNYGYIYSLINIKKYMNVKI